MPTCTRCDAALTRDGFCEDATCPYSDFSQEVPYEALTEWPKTALLATYGYQARPSRLDLAAAALHLPQPATLPHATRERLIHTASAWLNKRLADDGVPEADYQAVDGLVGALAAGETVDVALLVTVLAEHERDCLSDDSDTVRL
jgi:hypothetical protein